MRRRVAHKGRGLTPEEIEKLPEPRIRRKLKPTDVNTQNHHMSRIYKVLPPKLKKFLRRWKYEEKKTEVVVSGRVRLWASQPVWPVWVGQAVVQRHTPRRNRKMTSLYTQNLEKEMKEAEDWPDPDSSSEIHSLWCIRDGTQWMTSRFCPKK